MKYFRVSLAAVKNLIFMFGNRAKDKHKLSETKRRYEIGTIILKCDIYDAF